MAQRQPAVQLVRLPPRWFGVAVLGVASSASATAGGVTGWVPESSTRQQGNCRLSDRHWSIPQGARTSPSPPPFDLVPADANAAADVYGNYGREVVIATGWPAAH
jgi:hypothetical protein